MKTEELSAYFDREESLQQDDNGCLLKEAIQIVELMTQTNMLMNVLRAMREALNYDIMELKLLLDVVTYNILIDRCFELGLSSEAKNLMEGLSLVFHKNVKTFNVLFNGYCLEGKLEDAVGMIESMVR